MVFGQRRIDEVNRGDRTTRRRVAHEIKRRIQVCKVACHVRWNTNLGAQMPKVVRARGQNALLLDIERLDRLLGRLLGELGGGVVPIARRRHPRRLEIGLRLLPPGDHFRAHRSSPCNCVTRKPMLHILLANSDPPSRRGPAWKPALHTTTHSAEVGSDR